MMINIMTNILPIICLDFDNVCVKYNVGGRFTREALEKYICLEPYAQRLISENIKNVAICSYGQYKHPHELNQTEENLMSGPPMIRMLLRKCLAKTNKMSDIDNIPVISYLAKDKVGHITEAVKIISRRFNKRKNEIKILFIDNDEETVKKINDHCEMIDTIHIYPEYGIKKHHYRLIKLWLINNDVPIKISIK